MSVFSGFAAGEQVKGQSIETETDQFTPSSLERYGGAAMKALGIAAAVSVFVAGAPVTAFSAAVGLGMGGLAYVAGAGIQARASLTATPNASPEQKGKEDAADRRFLRQLIKPL